MSMRKLNLQPGDEVIVQAINFVAAPLAVLGAGGQVVWAEVNPRTLQLDPEDVERRITPRTRAIIAVHMNGLASPMDELIELAHKHPHGDHGPLVVVGDAARATGAVYKGKKIGVHEKCTVFSLHTMKNISTLGEGGMMTTNDADWGGIFPFHPFLRHENRQLGFVLRDDHGAGGSGIGAVEKTGPFCGGATGYGAQTRCTAGGCRRINPAL